MDELLSWPRQRSLGEALLRTTDYRDPYTVRHQRAVAALARKIATRIGVPGGDIELIELGASLHDIGKASVPAEILGRISPLTDAEFDILHTHSASGEEIIADVGLASTVVDVVVHHHERLDGAGYPHGLSGDELSLAVRIVSVADVFDAMASLRPYRKALGVSAARSELESGSGTRYDPMVVSAALAVTPRGDGSPPP